MITKKKNKKKPWLAALLNIIVLGLGYIYVGNRKLFGTLLIISDIISYIWLFTDPMALKLVETVWANLAGIFLLIGLAIDAYKNAKEQNKK